MFIALDMIVVVHYQFSLNNNLKVEFSSFFLEIIDRL
jgi:hypothetical protein